MLMQQVRLSLVSGGGGLRLEPLSCGRADSRAGYSLPPGDPLAGAARYLGSGIIHTDVVAGSDAVRFCECRYFQQQQQAGNCGIGFARRRNKKVEGISNCWQSTAAKSGLKCR